MISPGPATRIFVATTPTDMRRGFNGLSELVRFELGEDPLSGHLFLFSNKRRTLLKILVWDSSGYWVCGKRLEAGTFSWPALRPGEAKVRVTAEELAMLLGGLDWTATRPRSWWRKTPGEASTHSAPVAA